MTDEIKQKPKMTKLCVVSDGNPYGTHVETQDGQRLLGVTSVTWSMRAGGFADCTIQIGHGQAELDAVGIGTTGEAQDD